MFSLIEKANKLSLPLYILCELFDQLFVPILLYGSEILGFQNIDLIESLHKKILKNIFKLN